MYEGPLMRARHNHINDKTNFFFHIFIVQVFESTENLKKKENTFRQG